jgi:hypothetical protein
MAGKNKAPQSEVDEDLAGQDAEVADKTHAHWVTREAEKTMGLGDGKHFQRQNELNQLTCRRDIAYSRNCCWLTLYDYCAFDAFSRLK